MIKILELVSFITSAAAFGYGAFYLFRTGIPKLFKLYVCAAGCYMLEELWVIVNSLLGNGAQDGLVTVRLFGFFGCLCFMLSANANEFDRVIDEGNDRSAKYYALLAPAALILIYALYAFSWLNTGTAVNRVLGFISISPALFASYYSMKHLLLPEDAMGFLKAVKWVDILALVFYAANYIYPSAFLYLPSGIMSIYDVVLTGIMFAIVIFCRKGASEWGTLI